MGQNITASAAVKNSGAGFTMHAAQASNNIDYTKPDTRIMIIAKNANDTAGMTATISVSPGDFMSAAIGTASIDIAYNSAMKVLGPFEGMRFKNSAGKVVCNVAVTASGTVSSVTLGVIEMP